MSTKSIFDSPVKNDKIDIYSDDIKIKIKESKKNINEKFSYVFESDNIDHTVINAIRRTILLYIPIYGFYRSNIHIDNDKSNTMYNNDMIYNLIETLPIYEINNLFDLENPELYLSDQVMKNIYGKYIQELYIDVNKDQTNLENSESSDPGKKQLNIEISLGIKNDIKDYLFITTHHLTMKIDGKVVDNYKKKDPISILVLRRGEELYFSAKANIGIAKIHSAYEATTNAIHLELSPSKYQLEYSSLEQLNKNVIFQKACLILINKIKILMKFINNNFGNIENKDNIYTEIELFGEEHTIGNLVATVLQKCTLVKEAGYVLEHPFIDHITIKYKLIEKTKKSPLNVFIDCLNYLINLLQKILNDFTDYSVDK